MSASREALTRLGSARRDAKIRCVIDMELVKNDAEADLLTALLKAYGDSPAGFLYHSPGRASGNERPPDAVLCHPEIGILVIDAKSHPIEEIDHIEAGCIFVRYGGYSHPKNVTQQAENQMYEIRNDALKLIRSEGKLPLFNAMVAFPRIRESEWVERGFDKSHSSSGLLFRDQFETRARLKQRIGHLVSQTLKKSRKPFPLNTEQIDLIYRVFGNSAVINDKRKRRTVISEDKLGDYVDEIITLDKYLSREQEDLSRMAIDDSPRLIRGVAGSGKSIVLAKLVARYLHRRLKSLEFPLFPEQGVTIAVTCFNRALVDFLKQKIRLAYREQTLSEDIPVTVLMVNHLNSLMYSLSRERGWPIDYIHIEGDDANANQRAKKYRDQILEFASNNPEQYKAMCFDAIFVDEGQDFEPEEFRLILDLIRTNEATGEKPVIIFYDDAQNVYGRSRPVWDEIGINLIGGRSYVMRECFRNTREIVELAFNVLLGSQAKSNQQVQTRIYADVNYLKDRGVIEETGDHIRVKFADREYQKAKIYGFRSQNEEIVWVAGEIARLVNEEFVRPEDILVIFNKPIEFDIQFLKKELAKKIAGIEFVLPFGDSADKDRFIFQTGKLTLSTVYGAKGYDAPIVFLVGADRFGLDKEGRAAFYVGATRAKLLLYLSGVSGRDSLLDEAKAVNQMI